MSHDDNDVVDDDNNNDVDHDDIPDEWGYNQSKASGIVTIVWNQIVVWFVQKNTTNSYIKKNF